MSDLKKDVERKKKEVIEKLKNGAFIAKAQPPSSSHGLFWQHLLRIKCSSDQYQPFVQCGLCNDILSYSISNGTSTISYHVKNCLEKSNQLKNNNTLDKYLNKSNEVSVSPDDKRSITIACAKFCALDMRSFNIVKGPGFTNLCQSLINLGYQYGVAKLGAPTSTLLLPDPTNISRTISRISNDYRNKLKDIMMVDLKAVRLIGISSDYWKNSGTNLLLERNEAHYLQDINRKLVKDVEKFLSLFKVASEQLSADTSPTLHLVVPWFWKLKASCIPNQDDSLLLNQFKNAVSNMLDDKVHLTSLHYIATCLYPATKKLQTLEDSYRNEIYADIRKIIVTLGIREENSSLSSKTNSKTTNKRLKKKKNNFIKENDVMVEFAGDPEDDSDDDSDELERYLKTKLSFTKDDTIIQWWNKHSLLFPELALLAKSLLGIPASSATSERIFSASGRILEKRRQSLNPDVVHDMLMMRNFRDI
ncbi:unnamed protein product [Adineta steineri]|uniref:BED-type domain-containing protein n=1 Tax=Adineta steineri TaxID=433720 RepID=A0A815GNQ1_9BILA|nr:unnamed protein product [Adineta steineri]CAF1340950.1 unnamed protein product [Adineta steineri]CAF1356677.1 unnamed protein product [Adineta steineri]